MYGSRRTAAVVALLVVGLALSALFGVHVSGFDTTQVATEVSSETDPAAVAERVDAVLDAESLVEGHPSGSRRAVETALETGRYDGDDHPTELHVALDDADHRFAAYGGSYYRWNATTGANASAVTIRAEPVDAETVLSELAVPYEQASPEARQAVDEGEVEDAVVTESVIVRDGTYYVVGLENPTETTVRLLATPFVLVLTSAGRAYLGVALGLLALLYRRRGDRPLDGRRGLAVAGLAIPASWLATALTESGSVLINYGVEPAFALAVALWLVAGVGLRRARYVTVLGGGLGVGLLAVAAGGVLGGIFGGVAVVVGLVAAVVPGLVLVPYGYYLTPAPADGTTDADGGTTGDGRADAESSP